MAAELIPHMCSRNFMVFYDWILSWIPKHKTVLFLLPVQKKHVLNFLTTSSHDSKSSIKVLKPYSTFSDALQIMIIIFILTSTFHVFMGWTVSYERLPSTMSLVRSLLTFLSSNSLLITSFHFYWAVMWINYHRLWIERSKFTRS